MHANTRQPKSMAIQGLIMYGVTGLLRQRPTVSIMSAGLNRH